MAYWTSYTMGYTWTAETDELPVGAIALWSLLNGAIPTGWVECDGVANAPGPDLRDRFIVGRGAKPVDTSGGAATHVHADFLTHGTTVGVHIFTQPSGHSNHLVTQPTAHGAISAHGTHAHELPVQLVSGTVSRQLASTVFGTGTSRAAQSTQTETANTTSAAVALSQTVVVGAHTALTNNHLGSAVDAHSAHAGGAVDAHVVGNPSHTAHAATNHEPAWFALIYIQRMT
jgi:hypothetical protein